MPHHNSIRDRWLLRLIRLLCLLPLAILYRIADGLFVILFYVLRYQRALITNNLSSTLTHYTPSEIQKLARKNYRNTLHVVFEVIKSQCLSREQLLKRIHFSNASVARQHLDAGQSILVLTTHQCNWEWSQLACRIFFNYPVHVVYKPLNHKKLDQLVRKIRTRFGSQMIPVGNQLGSLLNDRTQAKIIVLAADLGPRPDEKQSWHQFLGRETAFYPGAEIIARRLKIPVIFASMSRTGRGHYEIHLQHLSQADSQKNSLMADYVDALGNAISAQPEDWLWSYKRWKYTQTQAQGFKKQSL